MVSGKWLVVSDEKNNLLRRFASLQLKTDHLPLNIIYYIKIVGIASVREFDIMILEKER